MKRAIFAVLIGLSCSWANVVCQEKPLWVTQVEREFQEKELKWKISAKDVQDVKGYFHETLNLKAGALRADVSITVLGSSERATEQFEGEKIAFSNILSKDAAKSTLEGVGDDNFMFTGKGRRKYGNIFIKQGNVLIKVFAPSVETARRFAKYVTDFMPPSNKSLERTPR